jgi:hypothetical protein
MPNGGRHVQTSLHVEGVARVRCSPKHVVKIINLEWPHVLPLREARPVPKPDLDPVILEETRKIAAVPGNILRIAPKVVTVVDSNSP